MGWNHQQELVSKVEFKSTLEQLMFFNQQNSLWNRSKRLPGHATAMGTTPWPIPHWHSCFFRWFSLRFSLISMFRTISISLSYLFIIVDPISAGQKLIISQQFSPTFSPTFSGKKTIRPCQGDGCRAFGRSCCGGEVVPHGMPEVGPAENGAGTNRTGWTGDWTTKNYIKNWGFSRRFVGILLRFVGILLGLFSSNQRWLENAPL